MINFFVYSAMKLRTIDIDTLVYRTFVNSYKRKFKRFHDDDENVDFITSICLSQLCHLRSCDWPTEENKTKFWSWKNPEFEFFTILQTQWANVTAKWIVENSHNSFCEFACLFCFYQLETEIHTHPRRWWHCWWTWGEFTKIFNSRVWMLSMLHTLCSILVMYYILNESDKWFFFTCWIYILVKIYFVSLRKSQLRSVHGLLICK